MDARPATWSWNASHRATLRSTALAGLLGLPPGQSCRFDDFVANVHADDREALSRAFSGLLGGPDHDAFDTTVRIVLPTGAVRPLRLIGLVIDRADDGSALRADGVVLEVPGAAVHRMGTPDPTSDDAARRMLEERLELAQQTVNVAFLDWDVLADKVRISGFLRRLVEVDPGTDWASLPRWVARVDPGDWAEVVRLIGSAADAGHRRASCEFRIEARAGVRWLNANASLDYDSGGRLAMVRSVVHDVTDRKHGEEQRARILARESLLRERTARLQALASTLSLATRPEHVIEGAAAHGGNAVGAASNTLLLLEESGRAFRLVAGPGVRPDVAADWPRIPIDGPFPAALAVSTGAPRYSRTRDEYVAHDPRLERVARRTGLQANAAVPLLAGESVLGVMDLMFDAPQPFDDDTDTFLRAIAQLCAQALQRTRLMDLEREAHAQAQRAHARLDVALAAGGMGVWDRDLRTGESQWSREMYGLLGLAPDEQGRGRTPLLMASIHKDDHDRVHARVETAIRECGEFHEEYRITAADGSTRWLVSRGRVICNERGEAERLVGIAFDVTQRRATEQRLRETDARRDEFLAMLAHELRNPLAPLVNGLALLERVDLADERLRVITDLMRRQVTQLSRLVDDLLEVSRITHGRITLIKDTVPVCGPIGNATESVRGLLREHRHTLLVNVPPDLEVLADPARLTQVVTNLLNNAAKYTPDGGTIRVDATLENDRFVRITVSDNGTGIDAQLLPRIFELFAQGESTLDRSLGGLGIGLALVRRLVELHGGSVQAQSEGPGTGARFIIRLPRVERRSVPRPATQPGSGGVLAPSHILVVDDNRDAARSLAMLLGADGHQVTIAHDGDQALSAAVGDPPDIVILDIGLPGLDGYGVARLLRTKLAGRVPLIAALSGYGQQSDRKRSEEAGIDVHLVKPTGLGEIYGALAAAMIARAGLREP